MKSIDSPYLQLRGGVGLMSLAGEQHVQAAGAGGGVNEDTF